jgi:hypothetical protein
MNNKIKSLLTLIIIIAISCKSGTNSNSKNTDSMSINAAKDSLNKIDSISKNSKIQEIIYEGDKGFDKTAAREAQEFVIKALDLKAQLNETKNEINCGFNLEDSCYNIEIVYKDGAYGKYRSQSVFYNYYPKIKLILNGISFDTIFFNKKFPNH